MSKKEMYEILSSAWDLLYNVQKELHPDDQKEVSETRMGLEQLMTMIKQEVIVLK